MTKKVSVPRLFESGLWDGKQSLLGGPEALNKASRVTVSESNHLGL